MFRAVKIHFQGFTALCKSFSHEKIFSTLTLSLHTDNLQSEKQQEQSGKNRK